MPDLQGENKLMPSGRRRLLLWECLGVEAAADGGYSFGRQGNQAGNVRIAPAHFGQEADVEVSAAEVTKAGQFLCKAIVRLVRQAAQRLPIGRCRRSAFVQQLFEPAAPLVAEEETVYYIALALQGFGFKVRRWEAGSLAVQL